jgi:hypothetical protein
MLVKTDIHVGDRPRARGHLARLCIRSAARRRSASRRNCYAGRRRSSTWRPTGGPTTATTRPRLRARRQQWPHRQRSRSWGAGQGVAAEEDQQTQRDAAERCSHGLGHQFSFRHAEADARRSPSRQPPAAAPGPAAAHAGRARRVLQPLPVARPSVVLTTPDHSWGNHLPLKSPDLWRSTAFRGRGGFLEGGGSASA